MPRSLSVNRVKRKSKKRSVSLNLERARENKRKNNASNKIKKFIRRVNNKYKGKLQLSRRNFNRAYQEQEQRLHNLYRNRIVPIPANTRPMTQEEIEMYSNIEEIPTRNMISTNTNAYPLLRARPENKRKTLKSYRSLAMLVPPDEEFIQMKINYNLRLIDQYTFELFKLYDKSEMAANEESKQQIEDEILELKEEIKKLNREIERIEQRKPFHITTQKPVYVPEARCLGSQCTLAEEERDENRLAVNFMLGINNNTVNRYAPNGTLIHDPNYRLGHLEVRRQQVLQRIDEILHGRTLEELTPEESEQVEELRQLL